LERSILVRHFLVFCWYLPGFWSANWIL